MTLMMTMTTTRKMATMMVVGPGGDDYKTIVVDICNNCV